MAKILFQNGMVVDGTGAKPYQADVLVAEDRIVEIGKITPDSTMEVIDAAGLVVAPGFIDCLLISASGSFFTAFHAVIEPLRCV